MLTDDPYDEAAAYVALRRVQNHYADIVTRRAWPELHGIMSPDFTAVTLMDCMAAIPWAAGSRFRPAITNDENA